APPKAIVGLRELILFRLNQGGDLELTEEVGKGVATYLTGAITSQPLRQQGDFVRGCFLLSEPLPNGSMEMRIEVFVYLGKDFKEDLAQGVFTILQEIEGVPDGRATKVILVLHQGSGDALRRRLQELVEPLDIPRLVLSERTGAFWPITVASFE